MGQMGNFYEKLDNESIRKRIKEIRAKIKIDGKSVNQEKFMEMVNPGYYTTGGSGQRQMSQWENADPLPPVDVLLAIARAGDVSLEWLLYGKAEKETVTPPASLPHDLAYDFGWTDLALPFLALLPFANFEISERVSEDVDISEAIFTLELPIHCIKCCAPNEIYYHFDDGREDIAVPACFTEFLYSLCGLSKSFRNITRDARALKVSFALISLVGSSTIPTFTEFAKFLDESGDLFQAICKQRLFSMSNHFPDNFLTHVISHNGKSFRR